MIDETEVNITRHKKKLEKIREERNVRERESVSGGHSSLASTDLPGTLGPDERTPDSSGERTEGTSEIAGTGGRDSGGIRQADRQDEYATQSDDSVVGGLQEENVGSLKPSTIDLQAERDRKRELARQRKQRQRDREREEIPPATSSNVRRDSDPRDNEPPRLQVKGPFAKAPEEVKLFTKQEAEEQIDKLIFLYMRGSELLDDMLEIVVKGHEKVSIWALSEEEAKMFAETQMDRAKKDKGAARVVRTLVNVYDKLYLYMVIGPRLYATGQHIKSHGGLSFK